MTAGTSHYFKKTGAKLFTNPIETSHAAVRLFPDNIYVVELRLKMKQLLFLIGINSFLSNMIFHNTQEDGVLFSMPSLYFFHR
ncbi:MAG: hypothetical protein JW795_22545 [Chitinivibrionales bacterium]|nr:hypothetical protein [Chitinivibrionales bacterium]